MTLVTGKHIDGHTLIYNLGAAWVKFSPSRGQKKPRKRHYKIPRAPPRSEPSCLWRRSKTRPRGTFQPRIFLLIQMFCKRKFFSRSPQKKNPKLFLVLSRLIRQPSAWEQQSVVAWRRLRPERRVFIERRTRIHQPTSASVLRKPSPGGHCKNPSVGSET